MSIRSAKNRKCIGCGEVTVGRKLSEEHILPRWLHPHVEMDGIKLKHGARKNGKEEVVRRLIIQNFVNRSMCTACNNGWMSKLEVQVQPILLPLIQGIQAVSSLSAMEKMVLSRWAFKTAFMIVAVQDSVYVPWHHFSSWVTKGAEAPCAAMIFGASLFEPHRSHRSFGYLVTEDEWEDGSKSHIRIGIIIQALVLVLLIPLEKTHHAIGIEDLNIQLLFSENTEVYLLPRSRHLPPKSFDEFLHEITQRVRIGRALQLK